MCEDSHGYVHISGEENMEEIIEQLAREVIFSMKNGVLQPHPLMALSWKFIKYNFSMSFYTLHPRIFVLVSFRPKYIFYFHAFTTTVGQLILQNSIRWPKMQHHLPQFRGILSGAVTAVWFRALNTQVHCQKGHTFYVRVATS